MAKGLGIASITLAQRFQPIPKHFHCVDESQTPTASHRWEMVHSAPMCASCNILFICLIELLSHTHTSPLRTECLSWVSSNRMPCALSLSLSLSLSVSHTHTHARAHTYTHTHTCAIRNLQTTKNIWTTPSPYTLTLYPYPIPLPYTFYPYPIPLPYTFYPCPLPLPYTLTYTLTLYPLPDTLTLYRKMIRLAYT